MNTITIDLSPEAYKRLEEQARKAGQAVEVLSRELLETALASPKAERPQAPRAALQDTTTQEEFRQQYPHLKVDPDLFALVGIHAPTPVEEDKALIRAQIFRRLSE